MNKAFVYSLFVGIALLAACALILSDKHEGVRSVLSPAADAVGGLFPIDRFSKNSFAPDVARIYWSIAFLLVPVGFLCTVLALVRPPVGDLGRREGVFDRLKRMFTAAILYALSILGWISFSGRNARGLPIADSVAGLAAYGWVPMSAIGIMFGVASVFAWKALFNSDFSGKQ